MLVCAPAGRQAVGGGRTGQRRRSGSNQGSAPKEPGVWLQSCSEAQPTQALAGPAVQPSAQPVPPRWRLCMSRLNKTDSSPLRTVRTLGFQKHALLQAAKGQRPLPLARLCRCGCNQVHGNGARRRVKVAIAAVAWRNVPPASMLSAAVRQRGGAAPAPPINLPALPAVLM